MINSYVADGNFFYPAGERNISRNLENTENIKNFSSEERLFSYEDNNPIKLK